MMEGFVLHGDFLDTTAQRRVRWRKNAWAVCEDGRCAGVFDALPERWRGLPVHDCAGSVILPGLTDLHVHAPQYEFAGLGFDHQLLDWLEALAFPTEARFADRDYAREHYRRFAGDLRRGATTRVCAFATLHSAGAEILMEELERAGLAGGAGKVNMDRNSPDILREESAAASLADTEQWILATREKFPHIRPVITPRFVPSCTPELLAGLGALAEKYGIPVQSHLDENQDEIALVAQLHPDCESYARVYDKYGLLPEKCIMAHCVYLDAAERRLLRERGVFVAHCPGSNANIRSGIAPVTEYLDEGLSVGLGSDVAGGYTLDMFTAMRDALSSSRLLWRLRGGTGRWLRSEEALFLATRGGGAFFGQVGAFEPGWEFDAVVVDESRWPARPQNTDAQRFERLLYQAGDRDVTAKYVAGRRLF